MEAVVSTQSTGVQTVPSCMAVYYDPTRATDINGKIFKARTKCVFELRRRIACEDRYGKRSPECSEYAVDEEWCYRWFLCPQEYNHLAIRLPECTGYEQGEEKNWSEEKKTLCVPRWSLLLNCVNSYHPFLFPPEGK
eukprot:TRINITY_DN2922_c0_g1_i1.p1 TRINITY_DN2922_c0_g1~~TRINITY_DN2922_c0_g1_i1.p1  ORF type:complete len:137 (+),score=33.88 TRINITY_DN2922_c0_g1_i1:21-431(+)